MSDQIFDIDTLKQYVESLILTITETTNQRFVELDAKIESMEKQIATLVIGFGEQAVFLEALLAQLAFSSDEQQKAFHQNLADSRKQMLKVIKDGSQNIVARQDERLAATITDMVDAKSSDS